MIISEELGEPKYVAFLDVLGFKNIVENKDSKLDIYFSIITETIANFHSTGTSIQSQIVSDSTILACDQTIEEFSQLLKAIQLIQAKCAVNNIWFRGAITIGEIYFNSELNIVVGKGLSDAYLLESQEKLPRVIIDPRIIQSFDTFNNFVKSLNLYIPDKGFEIPLIHDDRLFDRNNFIINDVIFVAFAEKILIDNVENLEIIYRFIREELYKGQTNYNKYLWLKNYFRTICWQMQELAITTLDNPDERDALLSKFYNLAGKLEHL